MIVAQASIKQAEDRLRALIFDPSIPDFWNLTLEPSDNGRGARFVVRLPAHKAATVLA